MQLLERYEPAISRAPAEARLSDSASPDTASPHSITPERYQEAVLRYLLSLSADKRDRMTRISVPDREKPEHYESSYLIDGAYPNLSLTLNGWRRVGREHGDQLLAEESTEKAMAGRRAVRAALETILRNMAS